MRREEFRKLQNVSADSTAKYWADTDEDGDRTRRRQAEFLIHRFGAWSLVAKIGVLDAGMAKRVAEIFADVAHKPLVRVERGWYY